ncbi:hypothetical protein TIFTF001_056418, partial [Ficus carica]
MKAVPRIPFSLLFGTLLLLTLLPLKITSSPRTQAEALVKWKNSLSSADPSLSSWSLSNVNNLCNWTSIVCGDSTGEVSQIHLSSLNLTGTLDEFDFSQFRNLTAFNLNNNNLLGTIPPAIGNLSR